MEGNRIQGRVERKISLVFLIISNKLILIKLSTFYKLQRIIITNSHRILSSI